jgi:hypothetical protein
MCHGAGRSSWLGKRPPRSELTQASSPIQAALESEPLEPEPDELDELDELVDELLDELELELEESDDLEDDEPDEL